METVASILALEVESGCPHDLVISQTSIYEPLFYFYFFIIIIFWVYIPQNPSLLEIIKGIYVKILACYIYCR